MTRPRPSRTARWVIGLSLASIFASVTFGAVGVAFVQVAAGAETAEPYFDEIAPLVPDATALAEVLDVDVYNADDEVESQFFDREGGDAGYAEVDITFANGGGSLDEDTTSVTWMSWPDDLDLPAVGDRVKIEYNSRNPEFRPQLAGTAEGRPRVGVISFPAEPATIGPVDDPDQPSAVTAPVRWTIAVSGLLTLVTLIGTVIWARRAAPATGPGSPGWTQPGWAQGQPQSYPQPGWPQPPKQPQYSGHPSQYQGQPPFPIQPQYPEPQFTPPTQPYPSGLQYLAGSSWPDRANPPPPGPTQAGPSQPGPTQPGPTQPGPTQPGPTQPGLIPPG